MDAASPQHDDELMSPFYRDLMRPKDSAEQIQYLGRVEMWIANLLQMAASSMELLALPPSEPAPTGASQPQPETTAPAAPPMEEITTHTFVPRLTEAQASSTGEARAEMFVYLANQYHQTLDEIHISLRKALHDLRERRISPSSIIAPPTNFVPPVLGVGPSPLSTDGVENQESTRQGLQETRVERDAWLGIVAGLKKMKEAQQALANTSDTG